MKRLFRWYVGDPDTPFWVYPKGWGWFNPKRWKAARSLTRMSTYDYTHGGQERLMKAIRDQVFFGAGVVKVPWSEQ